ncbi:Tfp pilus assembly protein FimV [Pseudomonas laurylsulfatiphila]|uniref:type IV pilus assembly protein FimV n=1 Tax=Pseudomonas laurylsulfatiphila TaxID=2011015 RepID=UPI003D1A2D23
MLKCWRLVVRGCSQGVLAGVAITYSAWAPALGLGEITLHSALNQPLRADIALVDAAGLEEGELSVSLATADEFSRAGVDRVFFLDNLTFTPVLRGKRSVIQVTSSKPVSEPFLNFLVQLDQPGARLLREYTVLIDPPGSPGIVAATDKPVSSSAASAFPKVQPIETPPPVAKTTPATDVSMVDPAVEQLAASTLQNHLLQSTVDELTAKLQSQDELIDGQKQQLAELQTQLAELKKVKAQPMVSDAVAPAPAIAEPPGVGWLQIAGVSALMALLALGWFVRRRRQQHQATASEVLPSPHEPSAEFFTEPVIWPPVTQSPTVQRDGVPANDELEWVDNRHSIPVAAAVAVAPGLAMSGESAIDDEYRLNLEALSMASSWDVISPGETRQPVALAMIEPAFGLEAQPDQPTRQAPAGLS